MGAIIRNFTAIGAKTSSVDRTMKEIPKSTGAASQKLNLVNQDLRFGTGGKFIREDARHSESSKL